MMGLVNTVLNLSRIRWPRVEPGPKSDSALQGLTGKNVEVRSYYPEIAYRYERCDLGYSKLMELLDPTLPRREYPEVSYAAIGAIAGAAVTLGLGLTEFWQVGVLAAAAVWLVLLRRGVVSGILAAAAVGVIVALAGVTP